jgi:hypothetical protein
MTDAAAATTWDTRIAGWEGRFGRAGTAVAVALVVQATSFFFYSHHFRPLYKFNERLTESYGPLCADPFTHAPIGEPQVRHRILGPLIAYAVGLRGVSGVAVLPAAVTVFLILLYLFARRWLPPASAVGAVLLMATTPVVIFSQTGLGYPDVLGHIALLLCLMTATAWPVVPILFLGMLGDERCAAAFPLVVLWHFWADPREVRWRRAVARVVAAAVAVAAWVAVYRWIQLEFVGPSGGDNRSFAQTVLSGHWLKEGLPFVPLGMYFALRAAWLFPAMFTVVWWAGRAPIATRVGVLAAYWAAVGVALGQGVLVVDVSRCVALCWPGVIIALRHLYHEMPVAARHWLAAAVVLNLFTPNYNVFGRFIQPIMPLPIALATAPR